MRHKFNNVITDRDGHKFRSKKEARRYDDLKILVKTGDVSFFFMQTPIHLPGGVKYVCDFLVFWTNGECTIEDTKGHRTPAYKAKKKMVEALYPFKITEL